jgi:hypothetical protein
LVCDPGDPECSPTISQWLQALPIRTLNVAGPSEKSSPGIGDDSYRILEDVFAATITAGAGLPVGPGHIR